VNPVGVIQRKRDGGELTAGELKEFVQGFLSGVVEPYQMTAFLMAVYFKGMTRNEVAELTRVMIDSGETMSFPGVSGRKVDKHSTGGVGDLVSLIVAPAVAACGVPVPMISGRGLGHTGGTLDKLESIPGLRTDLDVDRFRGILGDVGFAMGGQTGSLAPADGRMYALRDVTATVESVPLIVSSILSKKVAGGIDALVLDVKCGRGAFMKTEAAALGLAEELVQVGALLGKDVVAFVTDMDLPLGTAFGNAVEVRAALRGLDGEGAPDLSDLVLDLGTAMVSLGKGEGWIESRNRVENALSSGEAMTRFRAMVSAQGGEVAALDDPGRLPSATVRATVFSPASGYLSDVDPGARGVAVVYGGGGRGRVDDIIDPGVGIELCRSYGDRVEKGEPLAEIVARSEEEADRVMESRLDAAFRVSETAPPPRNLVRHLVTADGAVPWKGPASWSGNGRPRA
jgi:pyrimidine-nucleoside phosphorylase